MTNKEIITQLESIKENSRSHIDVTDPDDVWINDIIALNSAIRVFKRKESRNHDVGMKVLFVLDILIILGAVVLTLFALGGLDSGTISKQGFFIRIASYVFVILLSGTSLSMIWRGVGDE